MQLTHKQFYKYIKENGITKAELTKDFELDGFIAMPKGAILYFGINTEDLSTLDEDTKDKNKAFGYSFDINWCKSLKCYAGKFKIIPESTPVAIDKSKIIAQIKKKNKELNKLIEML